MIFCNYVNRHFHSYVKDNILRRNTFFWEQDLSHRNGRVPYREDDASKG